MFEPHVAAAALSLVRADGHPGLAKRRASHWPPCLVQGHALGPAQVFSLVPVFTSNRTSQDQAPGAREAVCLQRDGPIEYSFQRCWRLLFSCLRS